MTDDAFDKLPPHDMAAEMSLLAAFILTDDIATRDEIVRRLKNPQAFFPTDHQLIAAALFDLHRRGVSIDIVTLRDELKRLGKLDDIGGAAYLAQIFQAIPSAAHWKSYLDIVARTLQARWIMNIGDDIVRRAQRQVEDPLAVVREAASHFNRALAQAATNSPPIAPALDLAATIEDAAAGRMACLPFPWPALSQLSQALRPGTLTVFGGAGGDSKSLLITESIAFWLSKGVRASLFALEEDRSFHLARVLAQLSGRNGVTSYEWIRANPDVARRELREHTAMLDRVGLALWDAPEVIPTLEEVGAWIRQRAIEGDRIIVVDPVTRAKTSDRRHTDDEAFVGQVSAIAREHGCSIIAVTHPVKQVKGTPTMGDLAGGAAWSRFAQCVLFLRRLEKPRSVTCIDYSAGLPYTTKINRELKLMKTRSGPGTGKVIGFEFNAASLTFHERGTITDAAAVDEPAESTNPFEN